MELWRTRLIWSAIGSAATVLAIRLSSPSPPADASTIPQAPATRTTASPAANVVAAVPVATHAQVPTTAAPTAGPPLPPTQTPDHDASLQPVATASPAAPPTDTPPQKPPASAGPEPNYPLPRMPGMSTLRRSARYDVELQRWVLTRSSKVPAPASAVESFYTSALKERGLRVSRVKEPPDAAGTRRSTLKARGKRARVQIAIRQPAGTLVTTARVIWQVL